MRRETGWLLDLYPDAERMVLWFITDGGERLRLTRPFAPPVYVGGIERELDAAGRRRLARAIAGLAGLEAIGPAERLDFWSGRPRRVLELRVTHLGQGPRSLAGSRTAFRRWTYFNCDMPAEILFGYESGLLPTGAARSRTRGANCSRGVDRRRVRDRLRTAAAARGGAARGGDARRPAAAAAHADAGGRWGVDHMGGLRRGGDAGLAAAAPDAGRPRPHLDRGRRQPLLPALLALAQRLGVPLGLDREPAWRGELDAAGAAT